MGVWGVGEQELEAEPRCSCERCPLAASGEQKQDRSPPRGPCWAFQSAVSTASSKPTLEQTPTSPVLLMRRLSLSEAVQPAKCYHTGTARTLSSSGLPAQRPHSLPPGVLASAHVLPPSPPRLVLRCKWGLGDSRTDPGATKLPEFNSTFTFYLNNRLLR